MTFPGFNTHPGSRERHLLRKQDNPLFKTNTVTADDLNQAHDADLDELQQFMANFRELVQQAVDLQPNTESEVILGLKEKLDQSYVQCCSLAGDQTQVKAAINQLVDVMMKAVRQGAGNDVEALQKLDEEDIARRMHNELANYSLVADLLREESPIDAEELVPSLLSAGEDELEAALQIFDLEHVSEIYEQAKQLLEELEQQHDVSMAYTRLRQVEGTLHRLTSQAALN